jgi:hypothetical protein
MPAVESASEALVVLEGAEPVIDIVMPAMLEAMLDISIDSILDSAFLVLENVFSVQENEGWTERKHSNEGSRT